MNLSPIAYQVLYKNDPNLGMLVRNALTPSDKESLLSLYIKMTLLQQIPRNVALNLLLEFYERFNKKGKKVILQSSCDLCGCDPCDCEDWFGGYST